MTGRHTECLYFSSSGAPRAAPNPSISRVLEMFSREKTRYFSSSGATRAAPNPSISRVLERFSREKTRYLSSYGAPRAPPEKGAWKPSSLQPRALLTIYHKYTSILTKRKNTTAPSAATRRCAGTSPRRARGRRTSPACGSFRRPLGAID